MPSWIRLNGKRSMSPFTAGPAGDPPPLPAMLGWIARLGGYLGRKSDGPPAPRPCGSALQRARDLAWGCIWLLISIPTQPARRCVMDRFQRLYVPMRPLKYVRYWVILKDEVFIQQVISRSLTTQKYLVISNETVIYQLTFKDEL